MRTVCESPIDGVSVFGLIYMSSLEHRAPDGDCQDVDFAQHRGESAGHD